MSSPNPRNDDTSLKFCQHQLMYVYSPPLVLLRADVATTRRDGDETAQEVKVNQLSQAKRCWLLRGGGIAWSDGHGNRVEYKWKCIRTTFGCTYIVSLLLSFATCDFVIDAIAMDITCNEHRRVVAPSLRTFGWRDDVIRWQFSPCHFEGAHRRRRLCNLNGNHHHRRSTEQCVWKLEINLDHLFTLHR